LSLLQANHLPDFTRFPRLIYHDPEAYVLIMEDLGTLPNLRDYILESLNPQDLEQLPQKASNLGKALAVLQTIKVDGKVLDAFQNPDMKEVVYEAAVKGIPEKLASFSISDADILGQRCIQAFEAARWATKSALDGNGLEKENLPMVFAMGDMWPPSILLENTHNTSALIDWEFAGPALPLQDLSQLCECFEIRKTSLLNLSRCSFARLSPSSPVSGAHPQVCQPADYSISRRV
jgi:hypothetical protein